MSKPSNPTESKVTVAIFAEKQLVRESLSYLIDCSPDLLVTGTYGLMHEFGETEPIVISDIAVIYLNGSAKVEAISRVREANRALRIVVIANGNDLEAQTEALRMGAVGIVKSEQSAKLLIEAIRQTFKGETWLNQALLNRLLQVNKQSVEKRSNGSKITGIESLTSRETEVIKLIGLGLKSKAIASRLFISEATVRHHLSSIYGKLGVDDRLNLVIFAYQNRLIELSSLAAEA